MKRTLWLALLIVLLASHLAMPTTGPRVARAAGLPTSTETAAFLQIPGLKAVLIVGPIDGDHGPWTQREMAHMELAAALLEARGVSVHRFYTPNNDWPAITAAARGAHFLLYRGHGPAWNAVPDVGGFSLKSEMVTSETIARDLALAPNAIVMLYACYSAGSGGGEKFDIGIDEARRRVLQYSEPFLQLGGAGYYANWFGDSFEQILRHLFMGRSLNAAYQSYGGFNPQTAQHFTHPQRAGMALWLDKADWRGYWQYHNAFVGKSDATLLDLFGAAELGGIPNRLRFIYSLSEQRYLSQAHTVTPRNIASERQIPWTLHAQSNWVTVTPTAGLTGGTTIAVRSKVDVPSRTESYAGTLTVVCGLTGATHQMALVLEIIDRPFYRTFLPLATRSHPSSP
jgi:hypothetical protein